MKATLVLLSMLISHTALAGEWMFSKEPETAQVQPAPVATAPAQPARRPDAQRPAARPAAAPAARACTSKYSEASALFKEVHGAGADPVGLGQFDGSFKETTSQNTFKNSGGHLFLNMTIAGMINTDVPVRVCKNNNRLSVTLITSAASHPTVRQMVQSGQAPRSITLAVSRSGNRLSFRGSAQGATVSATATLR